MKRATVYTSGGLFETHPMDFLVMRAMAVPVVRVYAVDFLRMVYASIGRIRRLSWTGSRRRSEKKRLVALSVLWRRQRCCAFAMGRATILRVCLDGSSGRTRLPNCPMQDPRCHCECGRCMPDRRRGLLPGGACRLSSCTLAFMGGELRFVGKTSALGLSQPAIELTETEREKFIAYFSESGITGETF